MRKTDGVRVRYEKKSDRVRVDHEKKRDRVTIDNEKKERWGESSPKERAMG